MLVGWTCDRHNDPVTRPLRRRLTRLVAVLAVGGLALVGCSVQKKADDAPSPTPVPSPSLPTGSVDVPSGIDLTPAGESLKFGQPAVVAYQPNSQRSSVLQMTVTSVQKGLISDFAGYQLNAQTKQSTPYFVKVAVKNVGTGDLSHTGIPLYAVDTSNSLNQQTSFNNTFATCPSQPLPAGFTAGKSLSTCLVFVLRPGQSLTKVSYRPLQAFPPISWEGTITAPAKKSPAHKKKKQG
jgi:hypothetical protein